MSDYVQVNIDYGRIQNIVYNAVSPVDRKVTVVSGQVQQAQEDIIRLQRELADFRKQQEFAAALQRAITEIIRVRQELEEKFGTHKTVRDNMLGILQASDLSIVGKETITRCTEELMISAPKYWLAPSLIALAAWIGDNQALAYRAIDEGLKRDKEKTALLFALICRRNGRMSASFKWLKVYFDQQNPSKMRKSIIAFVDAYSNGVFGEDEEHRCDKTIKKWMERLKGDNPNFVAEQKSYWSNYYLTMCAGNPSLGSDYELLKKVSPQAKAMDEYVSRIVAVDRAKGIRESFNEILNADVNVQSLVEEIDQQLFNLVTDYEEDEAQLRNEEQFFALVKEHSGDEKLAKKIMRINEAKRYDPPVDFAKRLSQSITAKGEQAVAMSAKKTALKLLRVYIEEAFEEFMLEKKDAYPQEISLVISEKGTAAGKFTGKNFMWVGKTTDGENGTNLKADLGKKYDEAKNESIATVVDSKKPLGVLIGGGSALVLGIIFTIISATRGFGVFLDIVGAIVALAGLFLMNKEKKTNVANREAFAKYYDAAKLKANKIIDETLKARARINNLVAEFEANENSLNLFPDKTKKVEEVAADLAMDDLGLDDLGLGETAVAENAEEDK